MREHSMIERPAWDREQMAEVRKCCDGLLALLHRDSEIALAVKRLRDVMRDGLGGTTLEQIGYAWQDRVSGVWAFRSGPQPEGRPGPQPPPRHDVFILRARSLPVSAGTEEER